MAYFEGVGGSGGSIVVTCDSEFAGSTISCSDGTNTMTAVCPSVSPYEVEFMVSDSGTYEISATVSGTTYTTEVVVDLELEATLEYGFSWPRWVTYGGLDPSDYEDLADVFSDEAAVRRLMTIHASADYLIDCVTDKLNDIDAFCANDTAMKWIGLRDYVCDGLTAITGVEAKFLASQYWERYLKDHVPTMTSNTAPYGTASANSAVSGFEAYKMFDNSTSTYWGVNNASAGNYARYTFTNPICVKAIEIFTGPPSGNNYLNTFKVQASNDGFINDVHDLTGTLTVIPQDGLKKFSISNDDYYLSYRIYALSSVTACYVNTLQFYGRSLDVSVPVMTSNTAPYGEVIGSDQGGTNYEKYRAFDDTSYFWQAQGPTNKWIGYKFVEPIVVSRFTIKANNSGNVIRVKNFKLQASNDPTFNEDVVDLGTYLQAQNSNTQYYECDNITPYLCYRIFVIDTYGTTNYVSVDRLQFYSVDYSEKEFETGTTKKWLYDHGVELETLDKYKGTNTTSALVYNDGNSLAFDALTASNDANTNFNVVGKTIDLSTYSLLRAKVGNTYLGKSDDPASGQKVFNTNGIPSSGTYSNSNVIASVIMGGTISNPNTDLVIDLSAINENKWISIGIFYYRNLKMAITEWWLE